MVHLSAYALWPVAMLHGVGIGGDDTRLGWVLALYLACAAPCWSLSCAGCSSVIPIGRSPTGVDVVSAAAGTPRRTTPSRMRLLAGWADTGTTADLAEHHRRYVPLPLAAFAGRGGPAG